MFITTNRSSRVEQIAEEASRHIIWGRRLQYARHVFWQRMGFSDELYQRVCEIMLVVIRYTWPTALDRIIMMDTAAMPSRSSSEQRGGADLLAPLLPVPFARARLLEVHTVCIPCVLTTIDPIFV